MKLLKTLKISFGTDRSLNGENSFVIEIVS